MSDSIETLMTEVQKFVHSSGLVAYPHVLEFDIDSVPNVEWWPYPLRISRLERGLDHDREFAERYQTWLRDQKAA